MGRIISIIWVACIGLYSCSTSDAGGDVIIIATSANMQFVMQDLTGKFTEKTGVECELVVSSSGKLTAQIKAGAPYDVFVSADMKYPNDLYENGLAHNLPEVYALGRLVLWTMEEDVELSLDLLNAEKVEHIAIANPKTAPYGKAAIEVLEHYGFLWEIQDKLVFGESIAQTNQFISSKSVELGFTAISAVLSPQLKGRGSWLEMDTDIYSAIEQGVVLVKRGVSNNDNAIEFYDFLFSEDAEKILKDYGYIVNE